MAAEENIIAGITQNIKQELRENIDKFSRKLLFRK
jgi:hypothetical protein